MGLFFRESDYQNGKCSFCPDRYGKLVSVEPIDMPPRIYQPQPIPTYIKSYRCYYRCEECALIKTVEEMKITDNGRKDHNRKLSEALEYLNKIKTMM